MNYQYNTGTTTGDITFELRESPSTKEQLIEKLYKEGRITFQEALLLNGVQPVQRLDQFPDYSLTPSYNNLNPQLPYWGMTCKY